MINLLLSLLSGLGVAILVRLAGFSWVAGILPALLVLVGLYLVLARRTFARVQALMGQVQAELSSLAPTAKERDRTAKLERAVSLLEGGLSLAPWQFMVKGELHGQIAILRYMFKDYDNALKHFPEASQRNYLASAMHAALNFQKKDFAAMEKLFERAVQYGKKEGLVWAAYAWCLLQNREKDKAIKVLTRAVAANPSDDKLKGALASLQNDKKLKMKAWEPLWWQLHLEAPPAMQASFSEFQRRPRFGRR